MTPTLSELSSFGDVAAEEDAVLDYFLATDAVGTIERGETLLVLGRKGTGKTALVRYFSEQDSDSRSLNLRQYPWSIHATRIDYGASAIEAYVQSWKYLIAVELAALILGNNKSSTVHESEQLRSFMEENYGGLNPQIGQILRPSKLRVNTLSISPSILGNSIGGVSLERKRTDSSLGFELEVISNSLLNSVALVAKKLGLGRLSLHFDELDQGLDNLDDARRRMLTGLILAAREVRRFGRDQDISLTPVVYLRTDLWDETNFSDKNKISQSLALNLNWTSDELLGLINERLKVRLGEGVAWDDISEPSLMRGSQTKWNHILARTFNRPRDVIQFLNIALGKAKSRGDVITLITNKDIVASREAYSIYLKNELDDEIRPHWAEWEEALQTCSNISTLTFDRGLFIDEYAQKRGSNNSLDADQALEMMHRFSVVGYGRRSGYGGSSWSFRYLDPTSGWDNASARFKVHLGLKEYAKLREERAI
ncbi:MAG TPA: hypothetical protein VGO22_20195 [Pseudorhizobium sp.]|jgi:energy-coupling factor transporter ATP-binding protein EcfA2|nr:hypothetical protein [Pseudorhizobium sp.]